MKKLSLKEIIRAVNGEVINEQRIKMPWIDSVTIDSRLVKKGSLFIPIEGEKVDGHDFLQVAIDNGAHLVLTAKEEKVHETVGAILVKETKQALIDLAKYYRSLFQCPFIGITGSVGKTSCKEMLGSVLKTAYYIHKTKGNFNNDIGLPLTLLDMPERTQVAILEMGMNHFGEIERLSEITIPDWGIITNIGVSHIEHLGSREGILKAKSEIVKHMPKEGHLVLNGDDPYLRQLEGVVSQEVIFFGFDKRNPYHVIDFEDLGLDGVKAVLKSPKEQYPVHIKSLGKHMLYHALSAIVIAERLGLSKEEVIRGIETYENEKMRLNQLVLDNGCIIINDSYNASVDSVKAAVDVLKNIPTEGKRIAILGDMFEMGIFAKEAHEEVGDYVSRSTIDLIICVGTLARHMYEKAYVRNGDQQVLYYKTQEALMQEIETIINEKDVILVKGSRGMHLEDTIEKIKEVS